MPVLARTIEEALASVQLAAQAKGVRIQKLLDPSAGIILGDPWRLQQIVWNLLSNAIKFTSRGGRVQVIGQLVRGFLADHETVVIQLADPLADLLGVFLGQRGGELADGFGLAGHERGAPLL